MHRKDILDKLEVYAKKFPNEQPVEQFIEFVNENENCFERDLQIGHITASSWILSPC